MEKIIYDVGMHIGQDTKYYLNHGYKVLAIEANPELVEKAYQKFEKYIGTGQLKVLNVGIAKSEGKTLPFYKNIQHSQWSSFDKNSATRFNSKCEVVNINCTSMKELFKQYGIPYYLKVDIEGNSDFCLLDLPGDISRPKYVSCEGDSIDLIDILVSKGYTKFKMISQLDNFNPINLKKEAKRYYPVVKIISNGLKIRLQKFFTFKYEYSSSGPFGKNSKGEWLSSDEVKKLYVGFYNGNSGKPLNDISWFDFHATY